MKNFWKNKLILFCCLLLIVVAFPVQAFLGITSDGSGKTERGLNASRDGLQNLGQEVDSSYANRGITLIDMVEVGIEALLGFIGTILLVIIVYAGYIWLLAAGNQDKVATAKKWILNSAIGMIIISAAWIITHFVLQSLRLNTSTSFLIETFLA
jgi:cbb3-type cytochrome oxidase subunit 3